MKTLLLFFHRSHIDPQETSFHKNHYTIIHSIANNVRGSHLFSRIETTYEEDANRDEEVPLRARGAGAVNMTLAEGIPSCY